jgi:PKD repeat protein
MKALLYVLPLFLLFLPSCKKDKALRYSAKASFSVSALYLGTNNQDAIIKVGTHDQLYFTNESEYATSVVWDFGNGQTTDSYNTDYAYDSAGIYTVTLSVFNRNGTQSSYSRKVQAMERIIKKVTLSNLYLNRFEPFFSGTHTFTKTDLWIEVKFDQNEEPNDTLAGGGFAIPIIYKSPIFSDVDSSFHGTLTYELPVSPNVVITYPVRNGSYPIFPENTRGTVLELWGKDNSGTYLLGSSWGTGLHLLSGGGNPAVSSTFDLGYSVPDRSLVNEVKLDCVYQ